MLSAATVATSIFAPFRSMWSNSANKFFDALAASRPVAINYRGWQAELLQETGAGIVLPETDYVAAARSLAALIHDPQRLRQAREAAYRLAVERFSRDALAQQLEVVLIEALQTRSRA